VFGRHGSRPGSALGYHRLLLMISTSLALLISVDCVIIVKGKRCLLYDYMVGQRDTANSEGAVLHSPEPVKE
jgi:hypothetical protein